MADVQVNTENGVWLCEKDAHTFDEPLANSLAEFFEKEALSIVDIGCGSGDYVKFLRERHFDIWGIDGNPKTAEFCERCSVVDILNAKPECSMYEGCAPDWVLCLEVGEHIPPQHESKFLDFITKSARLGIVLSWFPQEGHGIGHFNPQTNEKVKDKMAERGFVSDELAQEKLRKAATLWWFQFSLQVFRRA